MLDKRLNLLRREGAVLVATHAIVAKDNDATSEGLRVNLVNEASRTASAVDQTLVVEIHHVVAQGGGTDAGEDIAADVLLDVVEVANGNFRDGRNERV